jgi:multidrug efflux pump subunit AcrA (membrane-fusion protein)
MMSMTRTLSPREASPSQASPREAAAATAQQARAEAREAAQQARDAAENARDIARAQLEAAKAEREAAQIEGGSTGVVTITKDGVTTVLTDASPEAISTALGLPDQRDRGDGDAPYVLGGLAIVCTAVLILVGLILRHRGRTRGVGAVAALPPDLTQRLSRMESGIDAMAVEVERISEGQRFVTRVLAERSSADT